MFLLGISGGVLAGNQDAAACLLRDGRIVAAVEEERLLGIKHANGRLPKRAIEHCLARAGIGIREVAAVGFPGITWTGFDTTLRDYLALHFGHAPEVRLFDHHHAHAASSYCFSGLEDALVLTLDFSGDRTCTALFHARASQIEAVLRIGRPNSLGLFYSMLTQYLGFEKDDEEYKVMGLASYGEPRFDLSPILRPEGETYALDPAFVRSALRPELPAPSKQEALFAPLPLPRPHRVSGEKLEPYHMDVAASAQRALEEAVLNLLRHAAAKSPSRNLCLAGGVALNCVMNRRIRESGLFDAVFVPPHVSDAGLSLGCAALLSLKEQGIRPEPIASCAWGPSYSDDEIVKTLERCSLRGERPEDLCAAVAQDLADGRIVGWFQGGLEFGPRALGQRSILADPRRADMKERVNQAVKFREGFRPFAPSCLEERAADYFAGAVRSPYMALTFDVRPEQRSRVPAITHVDGSARVQTVARAESPLFHRLIAEFERRTGVPMLLNTSLNVRGQPIVADPRAALGLFYSTGLGGLALGPYYLRK
jgi:carbamoyltransferase